MHDATPTNGTPRIGFYVCHCGTNIAGIVDVKALAEYVATLNGVVVSREYKYMCSDPGQELIQVSPSMVPGMISTGSWLPPALPCSTSTPSVTPQRRPG